MRNPECISYRFDLVGLNIIMFVVISLVNPCGRICDDVICPEYLGGITMTLYKINIINPQVRK